jgi:hypothetical protein
MKTRLVTLSEEYKVDFDEALQLAKGKLPEEMVTGRGKGTWITPEGVEILKEAFDIPEIVPKHIQVKILKECPNRCYNWAYSKEIGKRIPVLLPRKFWGRLVGKTVAIECIEDDKGVSYRYVPKKKQRA